MRLLVWLVRLGLAATVLLIGAVLYAGVTLTVRNRSAVSIHHVTVDYERGTADVGTLRPNEEWSENLGKLGEDVGFFVTYRDGRAEFQTNIYVYFHGLHLRNHVVLSVLNDAKIRVWDDGWTRREEKAVRMRDLP